jgi:hypothetical protein
VPDLRPSRRDIEALLNGTSLAARRAIVDAFETRGLLFGSEASSSIQLAANYRLSTHDLDIALARFDEQIRITVMSVLNVGFVASWRLSIKPPQPQEDRAGSQTERRNLPARRRPFYD